jgi:hypothetical protein
MTDGLDDDQEFEQRAKDAATSMACHALAGGRDIDWCIAFCRQKELEADARGNQFTRRWWEAVGTTLSHRQKLSDEAICAALDTLNDLPEIDDQLFWD